MKVKHPNRMLIPELIANRKLLVEVHVAAVKLSLFVYLIDQTDKKTVLIVVVIHDVFAKTDENFIVD